MDIIVIAIIVIVAIVLAGVGVRNLLKGYTKKDWKNAFKD